MSASPQLDRLVQSEAEKACLPRDPSDALSRGVRFRRDMCSPLAQAERREWRLANRRGSYGAGTVSGSLTRRYHALPMAAPAPSHPDYRGDSSAGYGRWLQGHGALAERRDTGGARLALSRLKASADHLRDAGPGSVGETFDGVRRTSPAAPPLQVWSVACTLEAWAA